jgi:hypothetical protein
MGIPRQGVYKRSGIKVLVRDCINGTRQYEVVLRSVTAVTLMNGLMALPR